MKRIAVLGSTGSIGRSTLSVVESYPDRFKVVSLAAGKNVGLANKECLVAAGELITAEARRQGKPLLPIDSEHNAVHQCLRGGRMEEVEGIWLTASGGPFLNTPKSQFSSITVKQALNHPTWKMGRRVTIDSATLMNKGFEVIEACRLFNLPPSK